MYYSNSLCGGSTPTLDRIFDCSLFALNCPNKIAISAASKTFAAAIVDDFNRDWW